MSELSVQAGKSDWEIMLLDFANAFNTVDRSLLVRLGTAHYLELSKFTLWLYGEESHLITSRGDIVKSSTGIQQGCSFPLFVLTIEFFAQKLKHMRAFALTYFSWTTQL